MTVKCQEFEPEGEEFQQYFLLAVSKDVMELNIFKEIQINI